jgi:hypothetical protein
MLPVSAGTPASGRKLVKDWPTVAKFIIVSSFKGSGFAVPFDNWRTGLLRSLFYKANPSESFADQIARQKQGCGSSAKAYPADIYR